MPIAVSILMLSLPGVAVLATLLLFAKVLCEGAVGMTAFAIKQSKQLEQTSSNTAKKHSKKMTKAERQIDGPGNYLP
jgi:hypothetical protein